MDLLDGGWGRKTGGWRGLLEVFCCKASSWRGYFKAHLVDGNPALALQRWCKPLQRWEPPTPGCPSGCGTFQLGSKGKSKGMPSWMSLLAFLCSMEHDHLSGLLWSTLATFLPDAHEPRRHLLCPAGTGRKTFLPTWWTRKYLRVVVLSSAAWSMAPFQGPFGPFYKQIQDLWYIYVIGSHYLGINHKTIYQHTCSSVFSQIYSPLNFLKLRRMKHSALECKYS